MIPRMRIGSQDRPRYGQPKPDDRALFDGHQPLRGLTVMIDADLFDDDGAFSPKTLLSGLLTHDLIKTFQYRDEGPPKDLPREDLGWGQPAVPGWIEVFEDSAGPFRSHVVTRATGKSIMSSAIGGDALRVAEGDTQSVAYAGLANGEASNQRRSDAIAALAAESSKVDIFITDREYLHEVTWSLASRVTFVRSADALPLISLYLRTQGEFLVWKSKGGGARFNRGLFYLVGMRELLPEAWRWFAGCVQSDNGALDSPMTLLGQSVLERIDRAIQLRDHVHRAMNQPQDNDVADDALQAFDSCVLFLMGALDAAARVAHIAVGIPSNIHYTGWQRKDWRKEVRKTFPTLLVPVANGTEGKIALDVLVSLRNTVHSTGITSAAFTTAMNRRERTLIDLSAGMSTAERNKLNVDLAKLGGDTVWGVDRLVLDRVFADPGIVIDQLIARVVTLVNALMAATPIESLPNVALTAADCIPPSEVDSTFREANRLSIRWQLGL